MDNNLPPLVKKQHFNSARIISNFLDKDNLVEIFFKSDNYKKRLGKNSKIFTAYRAWDQNSELRFIRKIEMDFYKELKIHEANNYRYSIERNHDVITRFWYISQLRFIYYKNSPEDEIDTSTPVDLSQSQKDALDRMGINYTEHDGIFSSRNVVGVKMFGALSIFMDHHRDLRWHLIEAVEGEFLVADCCLGFLYMPITPKKAFIVGLSDRKISKDHVVLLNRISITQASDFYFSKRLDNCPIELDK